MSKNKWTSWPTTAASTEHPLRRIGVDFEDDNDDETVEGSGPRHAHTRGLTASVRRERGAGRGRSSQSDVGSASQAGDDELDEAERMILMEQDRVLGLDQGVGEDRFEDRGDIGGSTGGSVGVQVDVGTRSMRMRRGKRGRFQRAKHRVDSGAGEAEGSGLDVVSHRSRKGKGRDECWEVKEAMPGGPVDGSVIPSFGAHIAALVWKGPEHERDTLRTYNRSTTCAQLRKWRVESMSEEVKQIVDQSGLAHLPDAMMSNIDAPLISAFVERWQPDKNSFHIPFGEMTILLHDVVAILRIPIDGLLVLETGEVFRDDQPGLRDHFCELLQVTKDELLA